MRTARQIAQAARCAMPAAGTLYPRLLAAADAERVSALHESVWAAAPAGTVRRDQPEFFAGVLAGGGAILGYETADGRLVAYGVLTLPEPLEEHYGRLVGLSEQAWRDMAQLEGIAVAEGWRGQGLQRQLARWRIDTAAVLGLRHVCATAAPANFRSWGNLMTLGLGIRCLSTLYGGALRYVLHRDLGQPWPPAGAASRRVAVEDLAEQRRLLAGGAVAVAFAGGRCPQALLFAEPAEV